jgi:hypothetical protein
MLRDCSDKGRSHGVELEIGRNERLRVMQVQALRLRPRGGYDVRLNELQNPWRMLGAGRSNSAILIKVKLTLP